jgi:glycosyltransferase involved in cell wall biosynthesis
MMPTAPVAGRVVVLQRVIVGGSEDAARIWVQRLRDAGALAVVFEIDDDELTGANIDHLAATQPISQADRAELERQREALILTLRACDGATVSTDPLADVVRRYTDRPVVTVPNAIDVEWFRNRLAPRAAWAEYLTIGWAGWRRPDADLVPMAEAWARIARRYPDVRFVVAGHQPDVIYRQDIDLDRIIRLPIAPLTTIRPCIRSRLAVVRSLTRRSAAAKRRSSSGSMCWPAQPWWGRRCSMATA